MEEDKERYEKLKVKLQHRNNELQKQIRDQEEEFGRVMDDKTKENHQLRREMEKWKREA